MEDIEIKQKQTKAFHIDRRRCESIATRGKQTCEQVDGFL
jgi:hypothetical protein